MFIPSHSLLDELQRALRTFVLEPSSPEPTGCYLAFHLKPSPALVTCHFTSLLWHIQTQTLPLKHLPEKLRPFSPNHSPLNRSQTALLCHQHIIIAGDSVTQLNPPLPPSTPLQKMQGTAAPGTDTSPPGTMRPDFLPG